MNKKLVNKFKKIIRFKITNISKSPFFKFEKYLKTIKIKICKYNFIENIEGGKTYKVKYNYKLNYLNPLTWLTFVIPMMILCLSVCLIEMIKTAREVITEAIDEIKNFKSKECIDIFKIKED